MPKKITTIGNLVIDDIVLYHEEKLYLQSIGGDALYSAIGANIWGAEATIHARVGKDFPLSFVEEMKKIGIKTDLINVPHNDIRSWMLYEPSGGRQFINHLSSGSNYDLSINGEELSNLSLMADGIHLAPLPTDIQYSVLKRIHQDKGKKTIVSWDPHVDYLAKKEFNLLAHKMLAYVDIFLPSQEEVYKMVGGLDLKEAAKKFADEGPEIVVIKKNVKGSLVFVKKSSTFYDLPRFPSKTIDPTGAGDSYCGGFMASFVETGDPVLSAAYGTVSASYVVEQIGTQTTKNTRFEDRQERLAVVRNMISELK